MDSAAINSFIPTLDQVDSWYEIFTLLPILIALELLLSADNAVALASLTKSLESSELRSRALNIGITISLLFRIILIILSNVLLKFILIRVFAGFYLIYLFFSNVFLKCKYIYRNKLCELPSCVMKNRYMRNRRKINDDEVDESVTDLYHAVNQECIVTQQLFDKIHCYLFHTTEAGYRLSMAERNIIENEELNTDLLKRINETVISKQNH